MATLAHTDSDAFTTGVTLTEFHYFPKLPIELRLKIWGLTIQPRTIEVRFSKDRRRNDHKFISKIPPLLHVHGESRSEGLRFYELSKQHPKKSRYSRRNAMNRFYFNPSRDMLHLNSDVSWKQAQGFFAKNECGILRRLRRIAIPRWFDHVRRDCLKNKLVAGIEITVVSFLDCGNICSCSTRSLLEYDVLKEIMEAEGRDSGWITSIQEHAEKSTSHFRSTWKEVYGSLYPEIKAVAVCARSVKSLGQAEIQRLHKAL